MANSRGWRDKDLLSQQLQADIISGKLDAVESAYQSTADAQKRATLEGITEISAVASQVEILDWCFKVGLEPPSDPGGYELYHQAYYARSVAPLRVLVAHGVDFNDFRSEFIGDALSYAAYYGLVDVMRLLLESGMDPDAAWGYNEYMLGVCALVGRGAIARHTASDARARLGSAKQRGPHCSRGAGKYGGATVASGERRTPRMHGAVVGQPREERGY
ncbi:hypothetical protein BX600DRAFT_438578 [Xylariales sp. PMI_506]|nr:hypothetical protein BX600DRAFT_438578 [Xylariales sp. PMI_506]